MSKPAHPRHPAGMPPLWLPSAVGVAVAVLIAAAILLFARPDGPGEAAAGASSPGEQPTAAVLTQGDGEPGATQDPPPEESPLIAGEQSEPEAPPAVDEAGGGEAHEEVDEATALVELFQGYDPRAILAQYVATSNDRPFWVAGRAFDEVSGEPLPGVRLRVLELSQARSGQQSPPVGDPPPLITGPEGLFREQLVMRGGYAQGTVRMLLELGGLPAGYVYTGPAEGGHPLARSTHLRGGAAWFDLPFTRGEVLRGRVLLPGGNTPAGGAELLAVTTAPEASRGAGSGWGSKIEEVTELFGHPGEVSSHFVATSGSDGRFELLLPPGSEGTITARAAAGADWTGFAMPEGGQHPEIVLVLQEAGSVAGQVLSPDGDGVPGTTVTLFVDDDDSPAGMEPMATIEDGWFLVEKVPPGPVRVEATPPEGSGLFAGEPLEFELAAGEERHDLAVTLSAGNHINVTVLSAETGDPIADASITLHSFFEGRSSQPRLFETNTDEGGRARIDKIPPTERSRFLRVGHPEYQGQNPSTFRRSDFEEEMTFHLKPLAGRELIVSWRDDRSPVTQYSYTVPGTGGSSIVRSRDGRTTMTGLRDGEREVEVMALDEEGEPAGPLATVTFASEWSTDGSPAPPVEVFLDRRGRRVTGTVVQMETRLPVAGATVELAPPLRYHDRPESSAVRPAREERFLRTRTDASGRFEFTGVQPGDYAIRAVRGRDTVHEHTRVEVPDEGEPHPVHLALEPGNVIHGRVVDHHGNPAPGVEVHHRGYSSANWEEPRRASSNPTSIHVADEDGYYRIEGVYTGYHTVWSGDYSRNRESFSIRDRVGWTREVNLTHDRRITMQGELRLLEPVAGEAVELRFEPRGEGEAVTAEFPARTAPMEVMLLPGIYTISVHAPGHRQEGGPSEITVNPRPVTQRLDLAVRLVRGD